MVKWSIILVQFMLLLLCLLPASAVAKEADMHKIIIDAGHGGIDSGAVAQNGTEESSLNLTVAQRLAQLFHFCGKQTVLTRRSDADLSSADAETIREKKVSDTKNRVALINDIPHAHLISIHQNSLPGYPKVRGAQVFYNSVLPANDIALSIQDALNQTHNGPNPKNTKAISQDIYLMQHSTCPGILVECGFLSNPQETADLQTITYQNQLVLAIASGYLKYE